MPRNYSHRECATCDRIFMPTGSRALYCTVCRAARAVARALTPQPAAGRRRPAVS